jgi:hypothetical protein
MILFLSQLIIIRVIYLCIIKTFIPWNVLLRFRGSEFTINHSLIVLKTKYILRWKILGLCVETGALMLRVRVRVRVRRTVYTYSGRTVTSLWCDWQIPTSLRTRPQEKIVTSFVTMFCYVVPSTLFCYNVLFGVLLQVWTGLNSRFSQFCERTQNTGHSECSTTARVF